MKSVFLHLNLILIFLPLSLSPDGASEGYNTDSLQRKLKATKGSEKIIVMNELANAWCRMSPSTSVEVATRAVKLADKYKFHKSKSLSYYILSHSYFNLKKYDSAYGYYEKYNDLYGAQ